MIIIFTANWQLFRLERIAKYSYLILKKKGRWLYCNENKGIYVANLINGIKPDFLITKYNFHSERDAVYRSKSLSDLNVLLAIAITYEDFNRAINIMKYIIGVGYERDHSKSIWWVGVHINEMLQDPDVINTQMLTLIGYTETSLLYCRLWEVQVEWWMWETCVPFIECAL